jgi:aminoglycoside 6'-N-acetyltransferase
VDKLELRTERLLLRPWRLTDVDDAYAYGKDPEWSRYLWDVPQPYTRELAEAFVRMAADATWDEHAWFAVEFAGHAVGPVHLYITDKVITDKGSRVAGLGYNIAREHWGRGYASEAAVAVVRYGFEDCSLHKIIACADSRNAASLRVMQKLGITQEAVLRKHRYYRGEWMDEVWCGILREEWFATGTS